MYSPVGCTHSGHISASVIDITLRSADDVTSLRAMTSQFVSALMYFCISGVLADRIPYCVRQVLRCMPTNTQNYIIHETFVSGSHKENLAPCRSHYMDHACISSPTLKKQCAQSLKDVQGYTEYLCNTVRTQLIKYQDCLSKPSYMKTLKTCHDNTTTNLFAVNEKHKYVSQHVECIHKVSRRHCGTDAADLASDLSERRLKLLLPCNKQQFRSYETTFHPPHWSHHPYGPSFAYMPVAYIVTIVIIGAAVVGATVRYICARCRRTPDTTSLRSTDDTTPPRPPSTRVTSSHLTFSPGDTFTLATITLPFNQNEPVQPPPYSEHYTPPVMWEPPPSYDNLTLNDGQKSEHSDLDLEAGPSHDVTETGPQSDVTNTDNDVSHMTDSSIPEASTPARPQTSLSIAYIVE